MRLHLCRYLGGRRGHQRLRGVQVVDVRGDGDVVAPVGRDVIGHVRAGRADGGGALRLAFQPPLDIDDCMGDDHRWHACSLPSVGSRSTGAKSMLALAA